jgi:hypothetical protein
MEKKLAWVVITTLTTRVEKASSSFENSGKRLTGDLQTLQDCISPGQ